MVSFFFFRKHWHCFGHVHVHILHAHVRLHQKRSSFGVLKNKSDVVKIAFKKLAFCYWHGTPDVFSSSHTYKIQTCSQLKKQILFLILLISLLFICVKNTPGVRSDCMCTMSTLFLYPCIL
jgi:hypothetical protein